jgi:hypothetical protein
MNQKVGRIIRACIFILSLFMIIFPSFRVYDAWSNDVLLVSIPLIAMFLCGFIAFACALRKTVWQ